MQYLFKKKIERTDGHMDGYTDGRTDKRTDGRSDYIMPQILFGGIHIFSNWIYIQTNREIKKIYIFFFKLDLHPD